jgi:AraC-like DNA-binding protein
VYKALIIYSIFQSLLFALVLFSGKKQRHLPLVIYFAHAFITDVLFLLSGDYVNMGPATGDILGTAYTLLALLKPAVTFYLLYSFLSKRMPAPLQALWILPLINMAVSYLIKTYNRELYDSGFYHSWYLNVPAYSKVLVSILLIWQVRLFGKEIARSKETPDPSRLFQLKLGRYFAIFYLTLSACVTLYMMITLANGRLYTIHFSPFEYSAEYYSILHRIVVCLFLLVFGYFSMKSPYFFQESPVAVKADTAEPGSVFSSSPPSLFRQKTFSPEEEARYLQILTRLMETEKLYLDPKLSLNTLALKANVPSRILSPFIQTKFGKGYKEYINSQRVEHARRLLSFPDKKRFTMYSIAFDSGFNSESSFYKIFKDQTGLTPKQYQDSLVVPDKELDEKNG